MDRAFLLTTNLAQKDRPLRSKIFAPNFTGHKTLSKIFMFIFFVRGDPYVHTEYTFKDSFYLRESWICILKVEVHSSDISKYIEKFTVTITVTEFLTIIISTLSLLTKQKLNSDPMHKDSQKCFIKFLLQTASKTLDKSSA